VQRTKQHKPVSYGGQPLSEMEKIKAKIEKVGLSTEAKEKALAELNKFTEADFRATHPGGALGSGNP